ncbi:MAG: LuxR C-terminal-related transcriptional regulator [Eubacteriales bacterium]|nr:LuxR C-terminal-related transcriptional regulator [Eubacteriales bacterium]
MNRHVPDTHAIAALAETQSRWMKLLHQYGIVYVYAMTGYGKTVLTGIFADAHYPFSCKLSITEVGWLAQAQAFLKEKRKVKDRALLVLDDLQWLRDEQEQAALFGLLLEQNRSAHPVHVLLLSRAALPRYLIPLQLTKQLVCEDRFSLCLSKENIRELLNKIAPNDLTDDVREELTQACLLATNGYGVAVSAYLQRAIETPKDLATAESKARLDVYSYLDSHLFALFPQAHQNALIALSIYECFDPQQARELLGEQTDVMLQDFLRIGSFMSFKAPETYTILPFFRTYLGNKLSMRPFSEQEAIYLTAAADCEKRRDYASALHFYALSRRKDRLEALILFLSENADGCSFAQLCDAYLSDMPDQFDSARLLGARAMLAAYGMRMEENQRCMAQLKALAAREKRLGIVGEATAVYVRTLIANPLGNAEQLRENLGIVASCVRRDGTTLHNILPTGNLPSLINGGLDLLPWEKQKRLLYQPVKELAEAVLGMEAIGIADAAMGEILYEQNARIDAMAHLTRALSDVNFGGSIRVQYAATAIMARLFQSEGQASTAQSILEKTQAQAVQKHYCELLPNISASLIQGALLAGDADVLQAWLKDSGVDEHEPFFITSRYLLMQKARVYAALGRTMEAFHCLDLMEQFVALYGRKYLQIEMSTLKAIMLYRRGEPWRETLLNAVSSAAEYKLARILADQGAALLPLWKELMQDKPPDLPAKYLSAVDKELRRMAVLYPDYLSVPKQYGSLTDKETEVLRMMANGRNNTEIAQALGVNIGTAKFHVSNVLRKLQAENRTVAVKIAQAEGLL